jgi:hypothetical protein
VTLHPGLTAPFAQCEATRADLLAILDRLDPTLWSARRAAGAWTVAEQLDHLVRSEVGTSKMARRLIRGDFAGHERPPDALVHDSRLDRYPYDPLPAPQGLVPAAAPLDEARAQLAAAHARFAEELGRFEGSDPDAIAAPDPATGVWFTLGGWVRLQALHEAHHIDQIREAIG